MPSSRPLWDVWDSVSKTKEESRDVREPNSQVSYQGVWAEVGSQEGGERVHELESWSTQEKAGEDVCLRGSWGEEEAEQESASKAPSCIISIITQR